MRCAVLLLLLVGCGGIDFEDFQDEQRDASCGYLVRCKAISTVADCRAFYARTEVENPSIAAAIEAGKLRYDEDAAQSCIDALAGLACDVTRQPDDALAACREVLTGELDDGAVCAFDRECKSDRCVEPECGMACCTGRCEPAATQPRVGDACTSVCADEAYCGADSICHAPLPAGAACDQLSYCARGLYCAGQLAGATGVCTALPHTGEPCESECAEVSSACVAGVCRAAGLSGALCSSDLECSGFYTCTTGGTCSRYPTRGMTCTGRCSDASYCEQGICAAQKPLASTCTYSDGCESHFCDGMQCSELPLCF